MYVLIVMCATALLAVGYAIYTLLGELPRPRTSARQRLLALNPGLRTDRSQQLRWSVRSRRVQFGWLTALLVAVAVLVAADRPVPVDTDVDHGRP
jgi:hypothetical protein